jgi:hypothetical protein
MFGVLGLQAVIAMMKIIQKYWRKIIFVFKVIPLMMHY